MSIQRLASRGQRLNQHGTGLAIQSPADDHHAVFILIHMQGPALVEHGGLGSFGVAVHPAPSADDALDVLGGAGPADGEESLLGVRSRDTGQRAHLRVRQLAAGKRLGQPRQRAERAGDALP